MTPEEWDRLQAAYHELRSLPPEARARALEASRASDPAMAERLARMLAAEAAPSFLRPPEESAGGTERPPPTLEDFELFEELGRGGMGVVYRARQRSLPRMVAVKILQRHALAARRDVERFRREAAAIAKLRHAGIVTVYEVGEQDSTHFFTMELVEGPDLGRVLRDLREAAALERAPAPGPLPALRDRGYCRAVAEIGAAVADALHAAHVHGVVHRDVKPSNILVGPGRSVKLVDFGIARDETLGRLTIADETPGTPDYMSPEQVRAAQGGVDHRTDVYSLGAVLYEMLTLRRPYEGANRFDIASRIAGPGTPVRPSALNPTTPRDLEVIVETAMEKDVRRRYDSAQTLRDELWRFLSHQAIIARPPSLLRRALLAVSRRRRAVTLLSCVVLASAAAAWTTSQASRRRELEEYRERARAEHAAGDLRERTLSALLRTAALLRDFPRERLGPPPEELAALRDRLGEYRAAEVAAAREELGRLRDDPLGETERDILRAAFIQRTSTLRAVFPEDPEVADLARVEGIYPTLGVIALTADGLPAEAIVTLAALDPATGQPGRAKFAGRTPLKDAPVPPGYYRVTVSFPGGARREASQYFGTFSMRTTLRVKLRPDEAAVEKGMVRIEGAAFLLPYPEALAFGGKPVEVAPFLIDACEVSIAEYRAFLRDTGRPDPHTWFGVPDEADALPAVGMTWEEAAAYAAWAGKRLPTLAEWLTAAGAAAGRRWPWGEGAGEAVPRGNVNRPREAAAGTPEGDWRAFLAAAVPVRSMPDAATPEGVHHLFGNVSEWTETMAADAVTRGVGPSAVRVVVPSPQVRLRIGGAWDAAADPYGPRQLAQFGISERHASCRIGFRCVRSIIQE